MNRRTPTSRCLSAIDAPSRNRRLVGADGGGLRARAIGALGAGLLIVACGGGAEEPSGDSDCPPALVAEVLAPATASARSVRIDCDLRLSASDVVTKRLILEGSAARGRSVRCRGATLDGGRGTINDGRDMVEVRSRLSGGTYDRPSDVTVSGCNVVGSIRVWGMARNGEGTALRDSSRLAGHVARARANAPTRVTLTGLTITATSRTPVYLAPGVTDSTLSDSVLRGDSVSVALYMDAESAGNEIRNNMFHTDVSREVIAVDGSSGNLIINNWLSSLDTGGIYFYRNCGEGGTIRHSTPSSNDVVNNTFFYDKYKGPKPSVFLGARNGNRNYCGHDSGFSFGSSVSNLDHATNNVIVQNQIFKRSLSDMIRTGGTVNHPNSVFLNSTVTSEQDRPAGCVIRNTNSVTLIPHGGTIATIDNALFGEQRCDDGRLRDVQLEIGF